MKKSNLDTNIDNFEDETRFKTENNFTFLLIKHVNRIMETSKKDLSNDITARNILQWQLNFLDAMVVGLIDQEYKDDYEDLKKKEDVEHRMVEQLRITLNLLTRKGIILEGSRGQMIG